MMISQRDIHENVNIRQIRRRSLLSILNRVNREYKCNMVSMVMMQIILSIFYLCFYQIPVSVGLISKGYIVVFLSQNYLSLFVK